jgi:uncharacterized protein YhaN
MRISRLSVDGFGALRDVEVALGEGLNVLAGPNEAGKSTLLSFCTGVLFGFPRRGQPGHGAPVRGGRHGGTLTVVDGSGESWVVERFASPTRTLRLHRPDGTVGDEHDLRRLLGGASSELFSAVFAVDLDGLASVRNVSSDEVREVLFTSAVLGQRRSASKACQDLHARRSELARPRQGDAAANLLLAELTEVRAELAEARRKVATHGALRNSLDSLEIERRQVRSCESALASRAEELETLQRLWERLGAGRDAADQLADLPPLDPALKTLLDYEDEVRAVATGWSGHLGRLAERDKLRGQLAGVAARIDKALLSLDGRLSEDEALAVRHDVLTRESLRTLQGRRQSLSDRRADARAVLERASAALEAAQAEHGRALRDGARMPASADEVEARAQAIAELRRRLADRQVVAAGLELDRTATARGGPWDPGRSALVAVGLAALALALIGLVTGAGGVMSAIAGTLALVALGSAAVLAAIGRARARSGADVRPTGHSQTTGHGQTTGPGSTAAAERERRRRQLADLDARIATLAGQLRLPASPTGSDVEVLAERFESEREARRALDRLDEQVARTAETHSAAEKALDEIDRQIVEAEADFAEWRRVTGLPAGFGADACAAALDISADVARDVEARRRIVTALEDFGAEVSEFDRRLRQLAADLDEELPDDTAGRESWLGDLARDLEECGQLAVKRATLEQTANRAESDVDHALGSGQRAEALRAELERGSVLEWQSEQDEIRRRLLELRADEERLVRNHETARLDLEELLASDRIAHLEAREAALETELDQVLRRYMVLGCARYLISATLEHHQLERQPEVIRRASRHFATITAGRYERLIVDPGETSRPLLRAISRTGESIDSSDLSRGTAEQLYLSLRLGLAEEFAERAVALPIVLDDVLVNFDEERSAAVIADLCETAAKRQVLVFTCHSQLVTMIERLAEAPTIVRLERT